MKKPIHRLTFLLPHLMPTASFNRLVKRANKTEALLTTTAELLQLFHWPMTKPAPIALITAIADGLPRDAHWLRVDPVALKVDFVQIYMLAGAHLKLQPEEMTELALLLQPSISALNCKLLMPHPERWYLQCPQSPEIITHDPAEMLGKAITDFLPQGKDRRIWLGAFNEWQMLLHGAAFNRRRLLSGEPTVDALWPWGNGDLEGLVFPLEPLNDWRLVITDHPVAKGLASLQQQPVVWDDNLIALIQNHCMTPGNYLICTEQLATTQNVTEALFNFLMDALKNRDIDAVHIYAGDGYSYEVTAKAWRFWRW